ncbi:MAG: hypothetical protein BGO55_01530 [Sphingobacteriales bacterium 50-39]|nr:MAG: hypothetical protein BGO55_01530 [Sphingobacteriales bacterium 50-39]
MTFRLSLAIFITMKYLLFTCVSAIVALSLNGCRKNTPISNGTDTTGGGNASVYIAGFDNGNIVYWKDGKENELGTAAPGYYGNALGIAIMGGDVYVAGFVGDTAVYWKNGVEKYLSNPDSGTAAATAIATSATDIYVAGYGQTNSGGYYAGNSVLYWKNDLRTIVATSSNVVTAVSIAVSGSDVYIAATIGNDTAAYWKNGIRTTLGSHYSYAYGIAVSGGDVYVVGVDNGAPVYWKNGIRVALPYTKLAACYSIAISGTDVYISGVDNGNAVYWKNGTENSLGEGAANAITTVGKDVYVTGSAYASQANYAGYWKNGNLVSFVGSPPGTQSTEQGNAIAVVTH